MAPLAPILQWHWGGGQGGYDLVLVTYAPLYKWLYKLLYKLLYNSVSRKKTSILVREI